MVGVGGVGADDIRSSTEGARGCRGLVRGQNRNQSCADPFVRGETSIMMNNKQQTGAVDYSYGPHMGAFSTNDNAFSRRV